MYTAPDPDDPDGFDPLFSSRSARLDERERDIAEN
jgi:hypothetical protein